MPPRMPPPTSRRATWRSPRRLTTRSTRATPTRSPICRPTRSPVTTSPRTTRAQRLLTRTPATATAANITRKDLAVTATGIDKIYDGNTSATVTLSPDKIGGDDVTAHYGSTSFADKNVASGKAVSVGGITITGGDAGNYHLTSSTAATTAAV